MNKHTRSNWRNTNQQQPTTSNQKEWEQGKRLRLFISPELHDLIAELAIADKTSFANKAYQLLKMAATNDAKQLPKSNRK
ncbi:hypothetical protein [Shewanella algae]|uniref:hypothetical protein n=1 Tax=Shewanella algae TaxID=38313 RepID=UPI0031F5CA64